MQVLFINADDTSRHVSSANTAIYPNLGLLTLMSALTHEAAVEIGYLDGTVYGNNVISQYIKENAETIKIINFSVLTANYGASVSFSQLAKQINPKIISIFGNDHFSALAERIMQKEATVDYGFYGNDIVEGFTSFVTDLLKNNLREFKAYAGLVYRDGSLTKRNLEKPEEYARLPFVDYNLVDSILPHREKYLAGQHKVYFFMRDKALKSQVVDIGRGCIKFAGPREADIPRNACDFCGIIPGSKPITTLNAERAWKILKNAHDQGFNYFYVTADELPLTMWGMLRRMAENKPEWYNDLSEKPKMFGYARAEGFETEPEKIDILVNELGFNHFFIGFDGLSEISLRVMNKRSVAQKRAHDNLVKQNLIALQSVVNKGCLVTAGLVVTHLGINEKILDENFELLKQIVDTYPSTFAALDFGPLCPIPGSQSFRYLTHPETAELKANSLGLKINRDFLESIKEKYRNESCFDMNEMIEDFITGCCPEIDMQIVDNHIAKITQLANTHNIVVGGGV